MRNNEFKDWQPERYLRFHDERTQPTIDLAKRIGKPDPISIWAAARGTAPPFS